MLKFYATIDVWSMSTDIHSSTLFLVNYIHFVSLLTIAQVQMVDTM